MRYPRPFCSVRSVERNRPWVGQRCRHKPREIPVSGKPSQKAALMCLKIRDSVPGGRGAPLSVPPFARESASSSPPPLLAPVTKTTASPSSLWSVSPSELDC
jgi:hypothetical protein